MVYLLLRRFVQGFFILFGVSLLSFLIIKLSPGSILDQLKLNPSISPETLKMLEEAYGLNENPIIQFFKWFKNALFFDFGYSLQYHAPVTELIAERLPNTLALSVGSALLSWILAFPLGILSAYFKNRLLDRLILTFSYTFASIPNFFLAFLLMVLAVKTGVLPVGGTHSPNYESLPPLERFLDYLKHLALPLTVLTLVQTAGLVRLVRSSAIEVLESPLMVYLKAKNAPLKVKLKHLLRNMSNPFITLIGFEIANLVSGAGLVEIITGWPGIGMLMLEAVLSKDIFLVMGSLYIGTLLLIVGNLIADILLLLNDPRIRSRETG
ncbi:MAG: ABC transporter permease [Gammaproteobacteria bacterium]|nr:MAG: ABC transporter permease [Gammaproteobacteria bacterium]